MRQLPLLALIAVCLLLNVDAARSSVTSIEYVKTYTATQEVAIWRSKSNEIKIRGQFLDLHTKLEVRRNGALVSNPAISLVQKSGGSNTFIIVNLEGTSSTTLGDLEIWVRYLVETNGPDKVKCQVFDRGTVTDVNVTPRVAKVGETIRFEFIGSGLTNARFPITNFADLNHAFTEVVTGASDRYVFTVRAVKPRAVGLRVDNADIIDRNLPSGITGRSDLSAVAGYKGSASDTSRVKPTPVVTGVAPLVSNVGSLITIGGTELMSEDPCFRTIVTYNPHPQFVAQGDQPRVVQAVVSDGVGTFLKVVTPADHVPGSVRVTIQRLCNVSTTPTTRVFEEFTDDVPLFFGNPTVPPSGFNPGFPGMNGEVDELINTNVMTSTQRLSCFNSGAPITMSSNFTNVPLASIVCTFGGQPLRVLTHRYASSSNITTASFAGSATMITGRFTISNGSGTATSSNDFVFVPPPSNATFAASGTSLRRGGVITVTGTNIGVSPFGHMLNASLSYNDANGVRRTLKNGPVSGTSVSFLIPADAAPGAVRSALITHFGGSTPVLGTITIAQ